MLLGTDAAAEGLNLQTLGTLINLDLPWNPTRLEQRKGRIQRIGQIYDAVNIYNMRYKDSVEDHVHHMLSARLREIYDLFGQVPDVLEDVWVEVALGAKEKAKALIDSVPKQHPFELRYHRVDPIDWEKLRQGTGSDHQVRLLEAWLGLIAGAEAPRRSSRCGRPASVIMTGRPDIGRIRSASCSCRKRQTALDRRVAIEGRRQFVYQPRGLFLSKIVAIDFPEDCCLAPLSRRLSVDLRAG